MSAGSERPRLSKPKKKPTLFQPPQPPPPPRRRQSRAVQEAKAEVAVLQARVKPITDLVRVDGINRYPIEDGPFSLDADDFLLFGMLLDPVYYPELMWKDPKNFTYGGQYRVRDYQYIINRLDDQYAIVSCSRAVGKTEGEKIHAEIHLLKSYDKLLITAPELIHLLPLTDQIEDHIRDSQLLCEMLDTRSGQTGFQHRPFQVNLIDGTKIVGRIPKVTGPQPLHARLATPYGWTTMGAVEPGDRVLGSDGRATEVLEVHEKGWQDVYRLHLSDGTWVEATADHRFKINERVRGTGWQVLTVDEIKRWTDRSVERSLHRSGYRLDTLAVPDAVPTHYEIGPDLPLDPWLLGVLLGDGGMSQHTIALTNPEPEIVEDVQRLLGNLGCELVKVPKRDCHYYVTGGGKRGPGVKVPLRAVLEELELFGCTAQTKRIPPAYMVASFDERLALLQGLLDTDGTCSKVGKVEITLDNREMVEQIAQLARSLGGWVSTRDHVMKPAWQTIDGERYYNKGGTYRKATFDMGTLPPFRLPRKLERCRERTQPRRRAIKAVELVGRYDTRCISVAANDHLYLTDFFIPTYNTGVKGQHVDFLIVEEGQDYPERGWTEVTEVVNYEARDRDGNPGFRYWIYGVHSGNKASGFDERARSHVFRTIKVTTLRRPDWGPDRKANAIAAYGGTSSPDYKRNILGEPGAGTTAYFSTARLMSCVDQNVTRGESAGSDYNENMYVKQTFRSEELDDLGMNIGDLLDLSDLPTNGWWAGVDVGLTDSPTVISLFAEIEMHKKPRIALLRRYTLERFRPKQIREALYAIGWHHGSRLLGLGADVTGLGKPIFQDMEDDELCPPRLREVTAGYVFNAKVEVGVMADMVTENQGVLRDAMGNMVKIVEDELTGDRKFVVMLPFIAASTQMIREEVDSGKLLLPFDLEVTADMLQETRQRVDRIGHRGEGGSGIAKKGDRFHILDSFRAALYRRRQDDILAGLTSAPQDSVLDLAGDMAPEAWDALVQW